MRLIPSSHRGRKWKGLERHKRNSAMEGLHEPPPLHPSERNRCPQPNCGMLRLEITTLDNGSTRHYCHSCGYLQVWKQQYNFVAR